MPPAGKESKRPQSMVGRRTPERLWPGWVPGELRVSLKRTGMPPRDKHRPHCQRLLDCLGSKMGPTCTLPAKGPGHPPPFPELPHVFSPAVCDSSA